VRSSGGSDLSSANTPHNTKYLTSSTVSLNGAGSVNVNTISTANSPLRLTVTEDTSITVTAIKLYAYDGTTQSAAPTGTTVQLMQQSKSAWVQAHGSGSALSIDDSSTPATTHNFYVLVSVSPTSVGVKSANKLRLEFTYQ
jgi:hypothetical protein